MRDCGNDITNGHGAIRSIRTMLIVAMIFTGLGVLTMSAPAWLTPMPKGCLSADIGSYRVLHYGGGLAGLAGVMLFAAIAWRLEAGLRQRNDRLARQLAVARRELASKARELDAFSYSVSHDLRGPLRSIDGFSQVLLDDHGGNLEPEAHEILQRVRAAAQRLDTLIDDLLNLARVTRVEFEPEEIDLSALARSVVADLEEKHPDRRVRVAIESELTVTADARLMRIVLENLLANAWEFTRRSASPLIEFGTCLENGRREFFVKDNGSGFDMRYQDKLFGVFQRLHEPGDHPGTGIGLATVRRIVERHGGRVFARAQVNEGATFYFNLASGNATYEPEVHSAR